MRTLDLDQFWPTTTDQPRAVPESSSATADIPEDTTSAAPSPTGLLPDWAPAMSSDAAVPEIPKRAYARGLVEAARLHGETIATLRAFDHKAAVWLSAGFISGMIAWHAIGFWSFVSATVLHRTSQGTAIAARLPEQIQGGDTSIVTGSLATFEPRPGTCMALAMDRANGTTSAAPCETHSPSLRDAGRRRRADRLTSIENRLEDKTSWTAATELTPAMPAPEPPSQDHPTAADFDLTLPVAH